MEIETQKFMALHGAQTWARSTITQVDRMTAARNLPHDIPEQRIVTLSSPSVMTASPDSRRRATGFSLR